MTAKHFSAEPSHYNKEAEHYDKFNDENSTIINKTIDGILAKGKVNSVLDLTCGTGSQVFWLSNLGYQVEGSDINLKMLKLAKAKAKKKKLNIKFSKGDMRTKKVGQFDAVLTIFNAIGHLTKQDFKKSLGNISDNLNDGGIYIFDIFNLNYLLHKDNITKLTIDLQKKSGDITAREIQYSTIDSNGILASYDVYYRQKGNSKPKMSKAYQTLQVYSASQLKDILKANGFKVMRQCNIDGTRFSNTQSERILIVAKKQG